MKLILEGDRQERLLRHLNDAEDALFIEQQLERFLNIEDRPVRGEMSR